METIKPKSLPQESALRHMRFFVEVNVPYSKVRTEMLAHVLAAYDDLQQQYDEVCQDAVYLRQQIEKMEGGSSYDHRS